MAYASRDETEIHVCNILDPGISNVDRVPHVSSSAISARNFQSTSSLAFGLQNCSLVYVLPAYIHHLHANILQTSKSKHPRNAVMTPVMSPFHRPGSLLPCLLLKHDEGVSVSLHVFSLDSQYHHHPSSAINTSALLKSCLRRPST